MRIILLIITGLSLVMPARANDKDSEKDWCVLGITDKCVGSTTFDIFEKIRRLEAAIKKGSEVYTPEEIKRLKGLLAEAYETKELINRY